MKTRIKKLSKPAESEQTVEPAAVSDPRPVNPLVELTADHDVEIVRRAIVKRFGGQITTEFIVALIAFVRDMTQGARLGGSD